MGQCSLLIYTGCISMGCPIIGLIFSISVLPTMKVTLPHFTRLSFRRQGPREARSQAVPSLSSSGKMVWWCEVTMEMVCAVGPSIVRSCLQCGERSPFCSRRPQRQFINWGFQMSFYQVHWEWCREGRSDEVEVRLPCTLQGMPATTFI